MGYANVFPFYWLKSSYGDLLVSYIDVTNAQADYTLCRIKTLNLTQNLTYAFCTLNIQGARDTSGAFNALRSTHAPYLTVGAIDAGHLSWDEVCPTLANGISGATSFRFTTNIASSLASNTTYLCVLHDIDAIGSNLRLYQPTVEIEMYFNA